MIALGLDGFRRGWVAVRIDKNFRTIHFLDSISGISALGFDRAAVDIPIGMTDDGARECDLLARMLLRPHSFRVFTGARRWLWEEFNDPERANREALKCGQPRISRQLWHLGPKIMEVDAFVRKNSKRDVRETHPELVFLKLNEGKPLSSKKSEDGVARRITLLRRDGFLDLHEWLTKARIGTGAKIDDVLDACACAIAARDVHLKNCIPEENAPADSHGLPMQIWY